MRRWNGWGEESVDYPLHQPGVQFIEALIGKSAPFQDSSLRDVLGAVPASRLPAHPLVSADPETRLRHARGQSFPDWVAMRSGRIGAYPDGVALPMTGDDVRDLLRYARQAGARVIPYGGGTSVVGHINPNPAQDAPTLTLSLNRMNRLLRLDEQSSLAVFGAGVTGPDLESQLRARGYTLGHYPQSFEFSTLGGWLAARSSGQQSLYYGRIERMYAGGKVETPGGPLELPTFPASSAGPDLREMVLGSEGRLGVITEAAMRIMPAPEVETFYGVFFPHFEAAMTAARQIVQNNIPVSMLRVSNAAETRTMLALAGRERLIGIVEGLLEKGGMGAEKSLMIIGFTGRQRLAARVRSEAFAILKANGGSSRGFGATALGRPFGGQWRKSRFRNPYLRNTLWGMGIAVDTLETAVNWASVPGTVAAIETALRDALASFGERIHVFTHLSHFYPHGASIYTTYLFRLTSDPAETLHRWEALKGAGSRAVVAHGGTISHQHGVGVDHRPYLAAEKGTLGMRAIGDLLRSFDPDGMMNPGKLIE